MNVKIVFKDNKERTFWNASEVKYIGDRVLILLNEHEDQTVINVDAIKYAIPLL